MKNTIEDQDPNLALIREIEKLEAEYQALKVGSQTPSIFQSDLGNVQFSVLAPASNRSKSHTVIATLTNADSDAVLFAYPQFSVFLQDPDTPDPSTLFPYYEPAIPFGDWGDATYKKYEHILDVNFWQSWGRTNNSNLVAMMHVRRDDYGGIGIVEADGNRDGATSGTLALEIWLSWRFLKPGAS